MINQFEQFQINTEKLDKVLGGARPEWVGKGKGKGKPDFSQLETIFDGEFDLGSITTTIEEFTTSIEEFTTTIEEIGTSVDLESITTALESFGGLPNLSNF